MPYTPHRKTRFDNNRHHNGYGSSHDKPYYGDVDRTGVIYLKTGRYEKFDHVGQAIKVAVGTNKRNGCCVCFAFIRSPNGFVMI